MTRAQALRIAAVRKKRRETPLVFAFMGGAILSDGTRIDRPGKIKLLRGGAP